MPLSISESIDTLIFGVIPLSFAIETKISSNVLVYFSPHFTLNNYSNKNKIFRILNN